MILAKVSVQYDPVFENLVGTLNAVSLPNRNCCLTSQKAQRRLLYDKMPSFSASIHSSAVKHLV